MTADIATVPLSTADALMEASYSNGWIDGWDAHDNLVQAWLGVARNTLKQPLQSELDKARRLSNDPCSRQCRNCSQCTRFVAVFNNRKLYGSDDYPGTARAAEILAARGEVAA